MNDWLSHASIVGHLGGYVDKALNPLSWMTGGKWTNLTSNVLPEKVNSGLSAVMRPFDKIDQTINPVRKIPIVNRAADIIAAKPGDALAIAAGAVFGGGAALAGGGAGGAGAGGAAAGGAGGAADVGGLAALDSGAVASEGAAPGLLGAGEAGAGGAAAGGGAAAASPADVGGLAAQDSAAVDAEGAEPGLTQGYGPANSASASSTQQQQGSQQQQEEKKRKLLDQLAIIQMPSLEQRQTALMVDSSRKLKTSPGPVSMQAIAHAGATGADQISENGVHIGAIRALHTQIAQLESIAKQRGITV